MLIRTITIHSHVKPLLISCLIPLNHTKLVLVLMILDINSSNTADMQWAAFTLNHVSRTKLLVSSLLMSSFIGVLSERNR